MKTLRLIGIGLFAVLLSFAMASCSGGDDDDETPEPTPETPVVTNPLVGTWVCDEGNFIMTITFNSNGTGKNVEMEYYNGSWERYEERFTYSYNRSNSSVKVLFYDDDEPETFYVRFISDNKMVYDGSIFVRIFSNDDITPEPDTTPENENRMFNVGGVEFTMVYVEGGTFMMGSDDADAEDDERPVHQVTLSDYYIGETEVTQALWQAVMGSNPSCTKGDNFPVDVVSWYDCQDFIGRLNQITGENFSLPTEAQWEFAARGGNYSKGYKYSGSNDLDAVAWYGDNSGYKTHPVGTKQANELGIYDMSGSVAEFCSDWYGPYSSAAVTDPSGPSSGSDRVYRLGALQSDAIYCRCTSRGHNRTTHVGSLLGLRLALK